VAADVASEEIPMWMDNWMPTGQISYSVHNNVHIHKVEKPVVNGKGYIRMALAAIAMIPVVWTVFTIIALA
jgi:hypothetical protein